MQSTKFLKSVQRYIANVGISGSSLRNQGSKGVVAAAREFLAGLDLSQLSTLSPSDFPAWLDRTTDALLRELPKEAKKWGAARKAVNIFTTQAFLNGELNVAFGLARFADVMETPLDSVAAVGLCRMPDGERLPRWKTVGGLTKEVNRAYQELALKVGRSRSVPRACLDVILWRPLVK
jgi:hypothetical protein